MTAIELASSRPDLEGYAYSWLATHHARRTRVEYARDLTQWVAFCHGHGLDPLTVDRSAVDAWITKQLADGAAASSVRRRVFTIRGWYDHLVEDLRVIDRNPAARVKPPTAYTVSRVPTITLGHGAVMARLAAAEGPQYELAFRLMFCNGFRIEEVCQGIRTSSVNVAPNGELYATIIGKGSKPRLAVFSGRTADLIRVIVWPPMVRHSDLGDRPLIQLGDDTIRRRVRKWGEQAGVPGRVFPHALRHAAGTLLQGPLGKDVKLEWVQDMLGHADPRTTRGYDRGAQAMDRNPSRVIEQAMADTDSTATGTNDG